MRNSICSRHADYIYMMLCRPVSVFVIAEIHNVHVCIYYALSRVIVSYLKLLPLHTLVNMALSLYQHLVFFVALHAPLIALS